MSESRAVGGRFVVEDGTLGVVVWEGWASHAAEALALWCVEDEVAIPREWYLRAPREGEITDGAIYVYKREHAPSAENCGGGAPKDNEGTR